MRQSKFFMPTLKEAPADAVAESHKIMIRGGYIRQVTAGVYAYLPLGYRVLRKAETIIEEEMENMNVPEMIMPHLLPATLWQESGRYKSMALKCLNCRTAMVVKVYLDQLMKKHLQKLLLKI